MRIILSNKYSLSNGIGLGVDMTDAIAVIRKISTRYLTSGFFGLFSCVSHNRKRGHLQVELYFITDTSRKRYTQITQSCLYKFETINEKLALVDLVDWFLLATTSIKSINWRYDQHDAITSAVLLQFSHTLIAIHVQNKRRIDGLRISPIRKRQYRRYICHISTK